jgi:GTPase SAR1 family protein
MGNKCDLENIRAVSVEEGKNLAEAEGLFFMETSALDSTNVKKAFEIVIREIYIAGGGSPLGVDMIETPTHKKSQPHHHFHPTPNTKDIIQTTS